MLAEVPGAVQVSEWQVVIPAPGPRPALMSQVVPADRIVAGPVDVGTRLYSGVTAYKKRQFPAWLFDGVEKIEKTELGDANNYPVGSTEMGIIVDGGPMDLACMKSLPDWADAEELGDGCRPSMLGELGGSRTFEWGMGTDDFVQEGKPLELFSTDDYSDGTARTVWIGGTDGTDVASVELVGVDGTRVDATVAAGTLVPDETMFWGTVSGELALAVTRDADGQGSSATSSGRVAVRWTARFADPAVRRGPREGRGCWNFDLIWATMGWSGVLGPGYGGSAHERQQTPSRMSTVRSQSSIRVMGPKLLLLFIVGDILGTGVYAADREVAGEVGGAAWAPFLVAFGVATITAFSYLELVTKYPQAAGAALYTHKAFGMHFVTFLVAFTVMCSGITVGLHGVERVRRLPQHRLRRLGFDASAAPAPSSRWASWCWSRWSTSAASARASRPTWCSRWSSSPAC